MDTIANYIVSLKFNKCRSKTVVSISIFITIISATDQINQQKLFPPRGKNEIKSNVHTFILKNVEIAARNGCESN